MTTWDTLRTLTSTDPTCNTRGYWSWEPPSQGDSSMMSDSESSSLSSACSATSSTSYTLRPRLRITYNQAALSQLHKRPQVRTLSFMSIPLPSSNDESKALDTPAEVEADSPCSNLDESPTNRARARLTPMTRGRVTNRMPAAKLHLQISHRVTNVPNPWTPYKWSQESPTKHSKVPEVPHWPAQPSQDQEDSD